MLAVEHSSDPPSPWAGYQLCLHALVASGHSHGIILQDDTRPAANLPAAVDQIAARHPSSPVCLFLAKLPGEAYRPALRAMKANERYITLPWRGFMPVVAVLWPTHKAQEFLDWAQANPHAPGEREPCSDDAMAGRWKMLTRQSVLATIPSLVEHPDMEPSLIGRRAAWGADAGRVALFMASDAADYDW